MVDKIQLKSLDKDVGVRNKMTAHVDLFALDEFPWLINRITMTDPVDFLLSLFMLLIIADRMNPFTAMDDDEFVDRFRLLLLKILQISFQLHMIQGVIIFFN